MLEFRIGESTNVLLKKNQVLLLLDIGLLYFYIPDIKVKSISTVKLGQSAGKMLHFIHIFSYKI